MSDEDIHIELIPPIEGPKEDEIHTWGLIRQRWMTREELEDQFSHDEMSEMIERAARAIAIRRGIPPDQELTYGGGKVAWKYFIDDASAVMEAIRDPTQDMDDESTWKFTCFLWRQSLFQSMARR